MGSGSEAGLPCTPYSPGLPYPLQFSILSPNLPGHSSGSQPQGRGPTKLLSFPEPSPTQHTASKQGPPPFPGHLLGVSQRPTFLSLCPSSTSLPVGSGGHHETQDRSLSSCWAWGLRTQLRASLPVKSPWKAPGQCLPWPGFSWGHGACPLSW